MAEAHAEESLLEHDRPVRYSIAKTGSAVICASIEVLVNSTALLAESARKFARR